MPKARCTSYNLALIKLTIVAEAEAVENNSEIAREYGISESMVRRWRKDQANLYNGRLNYQRNGRRWDASRRISGARSKNTGMVYRAENPR